MNLIKKHLIIQLALFAGLFVGIGALSAQLRAYVLIDNINSADVTQCQFGFIPIQGNLYKILAPGGSESRHPHNGYCNNTGSFGLGGEHDYSNIANGSNIWSTPSLIRTYVIDQAITLNVVGDESVMRFVYDGVDNNVEVNSFGLSGVDFTSDDVLRLSVSTSNNESTLVVNLYKDALNYSSVNITMPNSNNVYRYLDIPLSAFEDTQNIIGTGVDLSDVKSVEFYFTNTGTASEEGDSDAFLGGLVPNIAAYNGICNAIGAEQCSQRYFRLGVDNIEVTKQLSHTISAEIVIDENSDGDIDSAELLADTDTFRYTVTITNTDDMLDAYATNIVYTASFAPNFASFLNGTVTTTKGSIDLGNGGSDSSVQITIPTLVDGETVTITYEMKVLPGWENTASILYSHNGNIDAAEWDAYDTSSIDVLMNRFDLVGSMSASLVDDPDGDGYPGEGEIVTVNIQLENSGPNSSTNIAFILDSILRGELVVGSTATSGSGALSCGGATDTINGQSLITFGVINASEIDTASFNFTVEQPFSFGEHSTSEVSLEISGYCDIFSTFMNPQPLVITIDAFPNHAEAHADADADGLPDAWNPSCDATCQSESELTLDLNLNDTDNDGITNDLDLDDDNDGVNDDIDDFPYHCEASLDTDEDGMPNELVFPIGCSVQRVEDSQLEVDLEDDNDTVLDELDDFPVHFAADKDSDGDGKPDYWREGCGSVCKASSGLTLDDDDDNDGVNDTADAFNPDSYSFADAVSASADTDGDGFPDAWNVSCNATCQSNSSLILDPSLNDRDNDGVIDSNDVFPDDCYASKDFDKDGQPDQLHNPVSLNCTGGTALIADDDDDNDGIADELDGFPFNIAASVDEDLDGFPDSWNDGTGGTVACDLNCQTNSGLTLDPYLNDRDNDGTPNDEDDDIDGDGLPNDEDEDDFQDTNPPIVTPPADIIAKATGELTTILIGFASAADYVSGELVSLPQTEDYISASETGPFAVGIHTIIWTAVDDAGNIGSAVQTITVNENPDLNKKSKKSSGGGGSFGVLTLLALVLIILSRRRNTH